MLTRVEFGFLVRSHNAVRWHGPIWTLQRAVLRSKGEGYNSYLARSQGALGRLMETRWHCSDSPAWKIEDNLDVIIITFHILFCFDHTSHTIKARRALSVPLGNTFACPVVLLHSKLSHAFFCVAYQSRSLSAILASPNWASKENLILQSCNDRFDSPPPEWWTAKGLLQYRNRLSSMIHTVFHILYVLSCLKTPLS